MWWWFKRPSPRYPVTDKQPYWPIKQITTRLQRSCVLGNLGQFASSRSPSLTPHWKIPVHLSSHAEEGIIKKGIKLLWPLMWLSSIRTLPNKSSCECLAWIVPDVKSLNKRTSTRVQNSHIIYLSKNIVWRREFLGRTALPGTICNLCQRSDPANIFSVDPNWSFWSSHCWFPVLSLKDAPHWPVWH